MFCWTWAFYAFLPYLSGHSTSVKVKRLVLSAFLALGSCTLLVPQPPFFDHGLIRSPSCIIASIARLSYAVEYVQGNIEGNYQVNFAGTFLQGRELRLAEHNRTRRQHDYVVWYRSLRLYHMR